MTTRVLAAIAIAAMSTAGALAFRAGESRADAAPIPCDQARSIRLPDVTITEAVAVPAATTGAVRVPHCRVAGVIGSEIRFTALLPDAWNGKFFMGGGGGFVGTVQNQAQATVNLGYATAGTDTGHQGGATDASWALDNFERRVNFGYLAVHRTAETVKALIRSYYGADATRSYFQGCSRGGGQALMEAQRFPDDFDGIIAAAPAYDWTGVATQFIKDTQAAFPDPKNAATSLFPLETLKSVEAQILETCDGLDGVADGLMEDPRRCKVDVARLSGLTDAQRVALRKIYGETAAGDGVVYPAQPFGGEGERPGGWQMWITGADSPTPQGPNLRFAFGTQFFKYLVFNDPTWDYSRYDLSNWRKDTKLTATFMNATSPDLDAFKSKGHKLIVWHGWSDPALTALGSIKYYEQVQARDANVRDYFRLFLLPGVLHCAGGPGPDTADWTAAIVDWVENGKAADRIVARKVVNGVPTRSRPLCPYPQRADYTGTGSIDDERNFACTRSPDTYPADGGDIVFTPLIHSSVQVEHAGKVISVDPWSAADLSRAKPADVILITDDPGHHLDVKAIERLRKPGAPVVITANARKRLGDGIVLPNGQAMEVAGIRVEAIAAYDATPGEPSHPKGEANGYVVTLGGKRIYFAGVTECVPEVRGLRGIDVAFVPMNIPPARMTPPAAAECVKALKPKVVYVYHYDQDTAARLANPRASLRGLPGGMSIAESLQAFKEALAREPIEVRLANWYPH